MNIIHNSPYFMSSVVSLVKWKFDSLKLILESIAGWAPQEADPERSWYRGCLLESTIWGNTYGREGKKPRLGSEKGWMEIQSQSWPQEFPSGPYLSGYHKNTFKSPRSFEIHLSYYGFSSSYHKERCGHLGNFNSTIFCPFCLLHFTN